MTVSPGETLPPPRPGLYLVHKPAGATSFSLVRDFQERTRAAGIRPDKLPVCHGGALDPFAEGLVILLAGKATRLMEQLHPVPKRYVATIVWGVETDTGDALGKEVLRGRPRRTEPEPEPGPVTTERPVGASIELTPSDLAEVLQTFLGWHEQIPPATSNKRIDGERAYEKAHRGEEVDLPPSPVYLHEARFLEHDLPRTSRLELACRGGYYVRSLARDLGRRVGCGAHLSGLRRTAIGPWEDPGPGRQVFVSGRGLLPWLPSREVTAAEASRLEAGQPIAPGPRAPPEWPLPEHFPGSPLVRALRGEALVALLREEPGALRRETGLGAGL